MEGVIEMNFPHSLEPRWKFWLARLFGKRQLGLDHIAEDRTVFVIEGKYWRGRLYILKYHALKENN
jgi:hypothetical protein